MHMCVHIMSGLYIHKNSTLNGWFTVTTKAKHSLLPHVVTIDADSFSSIWWKFETSSLRFLPLPQYEASELNFLFGAHNITFKIFTNNLSFQKQCPGYLGSSADLGVISFQWNYFLTKKKKKKLSPWKLLTGLSVDYSEQWEHYFWKDKLLLSALNVIFKAVSTTNEIPFTIYSINCIGVGWLSASSMTGWETIFLFLRKMGELTL